ncbi:hypothetical protein LguiA_036508 [Lonicera macranthoides]
MGENKTLWQSGNWKFHKSQEGQPPLFHRGLLKDIYSVEGHFIDDLEKGRSPFLARSPDEARSCLLHPCQCDKNCFVP